MKNYVIITDSSCDLDKSLREKYGLDYVEMRITYDNIDVPASLDWEYIPAKEFYGLMRNGTRITTSQATADAYREKFEHYIKEGYDILSLSCSSALSSSVNGSYIARDDLKEIYPESKIICIDALNSCYGLGLMAITASEMRNEGKTIEAAELRLRELSLFLPKIICRINIRKYL